MIRTLLAGILSIGTLATAANAGMIVTLEAQDANGAALPSNVAAGTAARVNILLSVDGADNPLADLRGLQFDFSATSTSIAVDSFAWSVDAVAYSFQDATPPLVSAITLLSSSSAVLLTLTSTPVRVATVDVTINGSGVLDVRNPAAPDTNSGAWFRAGFAAATEFSLSGGNLSGGTISFTVSGTVDPGSGGGGTGTGGGTGGGGTGTGGGTGDTGGGSTGGGTGGTGDTGGTGGSTGGTGGAGGSTGGDTGSGGAGTGGGSTGGGTDAGGGTGGSSGSGSGNSGGSNNGAQNPPRPARMCGVGMLAPSLLIFAGLHGLRIQRRGSARAR